MIMNANELRILNTLLLYDEVVKITEIGFRINDYYLRVEGNKNGYYLDQFEPIELTEEILLKCGFTKQGFYFLHPDSTLMQIEVSLSRKCFINYLLAIEIKHLHQLQNLYYCLYGKELKIEL